MVVQRRVPADGLHQVKVDRLVVADAVEHEPVLDVVERADQPDLDASLLCHLAHGRLIERLARVRRALRQDPALWLVAPHQHDLDAVRAVTIRDTSGRHVANRLQSPTFAATPDRHSPVPSPAPSSSAETPAPPTTYS